MNFLKSFYLAVSKPRFLKQFKPLGYKKRRKFLISLPADASGFVKILPFVQSLTRHGSIVTLVPHTVEPLCQSVRTDKWEMIRYRSPTDVLSKEHRRVKEALEKKKFHYLIELNKPANRAIAYLSDVPKRICFYDETAFPYYNIMIKDSVTALGEFFSIRASTAKQIFRFLIGERKDFLNRLGKKKPLLFVNGVTQIGWKGDTLIAGKEISLTDPQIYEALYFADAYCGKHDALYEFAKLCDKQIIE
jgi:hypothetical protein